MLPAPNEDEGKQISSAFPIHGYTADNVLPIANEYGGKPDSMVLITPSDNADNTLRIPDQDEGRQNSTLLITPNDTSSSRSPRHDSFCPAPRIAVQPTDNVDSHGLRTTWTNSLLHRLKVTSDVVPIMLRFLRTRLFILLLFYLFILFLCQLSTSTHAVLSRVIWIPSTFHPSLHATITPLLSDPTASPTPTNGPSTTTEHFLSQDFFNFGNNFQIRSVDMSVRDLIVRIKVSELLGGDILAEALHDFSEEARQTNKGLLRLRSKILSVIHQLGLSHQLLKAILMFVPNMQCHRRQQVYYLQDSGATESGDEGV